MRELASPFRIHASSFGPADPVAIEQLFNNGIRGGEERLMLAVLQDAVECFQQHVLARYLWEKELFQEAENWILAKNTGWLFSFENICETLQLSPDYIRRGLRVWKEAKRKSCSVKANAETPAKLAQTSLTLREDLYPASSPPLLSAHAIAIRRREHKHTVHGRTARIKSSTSRVFKTSSRVSQPRLAVDTP
jgi:hypothetical protein